MWLFSAPTPFSKISRMSAGRLAQFTSGHRIFKSNTSSCVLVQKSGHLLSGQFWRSLLVKCYADLADVAPAAISRVVVATGHLDAMILRCNKSTFTCRTRNQIEATHSGRGEKQSRERHSTISEGTPLLKSQ